MKELHFSDFFLTVLRCVTVSCKSLHKSAAFFISSVMTIMLLLGVQGQRIGECQLYSYMNFIFQFGGANNSRKKVGNRFFVHFLMIRGVVMQFFFCFVCLFYLVFCFFHKKKYSPVGLSSMHFLL